MANNDITRALLQLAVATREHIDEAVLAVYEEDLSDFPPDVVIEACQRLRKTTQWFPKVLELIVVCKAIRGEQYDAERNTRFPIRQELVLTEEEAHARHARGIAMRDKFLADLRAMIQSKRMPS
jgi:hypothetical protein